MQCRCCADAVQMLCRCSADAVQMQWVCSHLQVDVEHGHAHVRAHRGSWLVNEVDAGAVEEDERVAWPQHVLDPLELLVAALVLFARDVLAALVLGESDPHGESLCPRIDHDAQRPGSIMLVLITLVTIAIATTTAAAATAAAT